MNIPYSGPAALSFGLAAILAFAPAAWADEDGETKKWDSPKPIWDYPHEIETVRYRTRIRAVDAGGVYPPNAALRDPPWKQQGLEACPNPDTVQDGAPSHRVTMDTGDPQWTAYLVALAIRAVDTDEKVWVSVQPAIHPKTGWCRLIRISYLGD